MPKEAETEVSSEPRTTQGMVWIGTAVEELAKAMPVQVESWSWRIEPRPDGTPAYSLIILGTRHRTAVKVFEQTDVSQCATNTLLQGQILKRLTSMLTFLGPPD